MSKSKVDGISVLYVVLIILVLCWGATTVALIALRAEERVAGMEAK